MAQPLERTIHDIQELDNLHEVCAGFLKTWCKPFKVFITSDIKRRSIPQNSYLWGAVYKTIQDALLDAQGQHYDLEDIHEYCKQMFGGKVNIQGAEIAKSTRKYSTIELSDYVERIRAHFIQFDINIPEPSEENDEQS